VSRWRTAFKNGALIAVCRICDRVVTSKDEMKYCPRGCHNREMEAKVKAGQERRKVAPKQDNFGF